MRFKVTMAVLALAVLAAAALYAFRGPAALAVATRAIEAGVARDIVAEQPDGLTLLICGSGSPFPDPARAGPCAAVAAGGKVYVVDAGTGGARNLLRMGVRAERIAGVLLTHFHSDHFDGLGELALLRWTGSSATSPLPAYGPAGIERIVDGFNAAYAIDATYRTAHHGTAVAPPTGAGMLALPFPVPPGEERAVIFAEDGLTISAFRVDHDPAEPAVGYRFDYKGRSITISGDTAANPAVERAAQGTDLLLHEALSPELVGVLRGAAEKAGRPALAKIMSDIPDYHTSPAEAAAIAARAKAGALVLTHIVPPLPLPGLDVVFLGAAPELYGGPLRIARDGDLIRLPAGTEDIAFDHAF